MCSSRNCSVPNVVVSVTKAMSGSITKTLVDGFRRANHHLSKRASQILVVRCSSQDHCQQTLQCSSLGPAHNVSPKKINKRTIAGTVTKKRHLEGCHYFNHHPFMGTTHRPSWYAEHHETTQCNYIADEFTLSASLD